jgi:hypothetical protein
MLRTLEFWSISDARIAPKLLSYSYLQAIDGRPSQAYNFFSSS